MTAQTIADPVGREVVIDEDTGEIVGEMEAIPVARRSAPPVRRDPVAMADYLDQIATPEALHAQTRLSKAYDDFCHALLLPTDIQDVEGKQFKKKSAWRKLGRAFQVSTEITRRESHWDYDEDEGLKHFVADFEVRATAPWGQYAEATGSCSTRETRFYQVGAACPICAGAMWDNRPVPGEQPWKAQARAKGTLPDFGCKDKACQGALHAGEYAEADVAAERRPNQVARAKAEHDVKATGETRATNRAISNLIAAGEVSAEEVQQNGGGEATSPAPAQPDAPPPTDTPPKGGEKAKPKGKKAAPTEKPEPPSQGQLDTLAELVDSRDFASAPSMRAWAVHVFDGSTRPTRERMDEALLKIAALPLMHEAEEGGDDGSDDEESLPF